MNNNEKVEIRINTEFIKLESLLKYGGFAQTGGDAKLIIQNGEVYVNDQKCLQRGKKIRPGDSVRFGKADIYVIKELEKT